VGHPDRPAGHGGHHRPERGAHPAVRRPGSQAGASARGGDRGRGGPSRRDRRVGHRYLGRLCPLGKMLGLEAIDEDAAIATIRGGQTKPIEEQTAAEKTARGVSEVATGMTLGALPLIGPLFNTARNTQGLAAALGELWTAPEKAADRASALPADADAAMALHQAAAAIETWQEKFPASVEFGALAPAPQDITNDVTIQNTKIG